MKSYSIPVCLLYHKKIEVSCSLDIKIPKYGFHQEFLITEIAQDIFQSKDAIPVKEIKFNVDSGRIPYWMDFRMTASDPYISLVLFMPKVDVTFDKINFENVPIKNISQSLDGTEIGVDIPDLDPRFRCRSWANAHLKNNNHLKWRFHVDIQDGMTRKKQLNML